MEHIVKSVTVAATPESVFPLISLPKYAAQIIPGLTQVRDVEQLSMRGWRYHWTREFLGAYFEGTTRMTVEAFAHQLTVRTTGGLACNEVWTLEADGDNTHVTLTCDFVLPMPLMHKRALGDIREGLEREAEQQLANLRALVEAEKAHTDERQAQ